jgi:hypothetical protein
LDPGADFLPAQKAIADSTEDPNVLALAANLQRVLVSHDYRTMPAHFYRFLEQRESPGLILVPQLWPVGLSIDRLYAAWANMAPEQFRNRIVYLKV